MSQEKITRPVHESKKEKGVEHNEAVESQIGVEMERFKRNSDKLEADSSRLPADLNEKDADVERLASTAKKITVGIAALVAIPVVASLLSPDIADQVRQWNAEAREFFMVDHLAETIGTITAVASILLARSIFIGDKQEK